MELLQVQLPVNSVCPTEQPTYPTGCRRDRFSSCQFGELGWNRALLVMQVVFDCILLPRLPSTSSLTLIQMNSFSGPSID